MMIDASIPIAFWVEMINAASYLQKRSPTIALEGRTPYEVLYQAIQATEGSNRPSLPLAVNHSDRLSKDRISSWNQGRWWWGGGWHCRSGYL